MEIEANIPPPAIRIQQKIQKYALRVTSFESISSIRIRTPISFPPEFLSGFDMDSMNKNKYKDWFERDIKKSYSTQLIRNLASLNQILETDSNITIQPYLRPYPPWQPTPRNLQIQLAEASKEDSARYHNKLIQELFGKPHDNDIFYTDGSQMGNSIGAAIIHGANSQKWNLGSKVDNYDAEIWAIQKALEWAIQEKSSSHASNVWVFSDSQESLRLIGKNQIEQEAVHQSINTLAAMGCIVHLYWVPGHNNIAGNESADKAAKDSLKNLPMANTWISISYIQRQIRANTIHQWRCHYDQTKTGKHYQQFDRHPGDHRLQWLKGVD